MNEARAIQKVCGTSHPHIVQVIQHGWLENYPYYFLDMPLCALSVQDYLDRRWDERFEPLLKRVRVFGESSEVAHMRLSWELMQQIITGLNYVHSCGVVHRDLKPRNGERPNYVADNVVLHSQEDGL
jgi:serine/threonine protein kinase